MSLTIDSGSAVNKAHKSKFSKIGKSALKHDSPKTELAGQAGSPAGAQAGGAVGAAAPTDGVQITPEAKEPASTETDAREKLGPLMKGLQALNPGA